jgi:hypothetical protein
MSDVPQPSPPPPPPDEYRPPPPEPRSGCLTALMVVIGIILLLPGACSLFFIFGGLIKTASDIQFAAFLLLLGATGVALLWWTIRGNRS